MDKFRKVYSNLKKHKIGDFASQSAFFIILSFIPFLIIFISLIQYINIDKQTLIFYAKEIMPKSFIEMSLNIIEEIYSKTFSTISISIVFTLWSASKGFSALIKGFHSIYERKSNNYIFNRLSAVVFTIFMILVLVLTFILLVLGQNIQGFIDSFFPESKFQKIVEIVIKLRKYILSLIIFLYFMILYKFTPGCKLKFKNQIFGAIFGAASWYLFSYGLSIYLNIFSGFSIMYGSLTTIFLFMIWVYYLIYVILIGAEMNSYFENY